MVIDQVTGRIDTTIGDRHAIMPVRVGQDVSHNRLILELRRVGGGSRLRPRRIERCP
jgi:hypothetical protein